MQYPFLIWCIVLLSACPVSLGQRSSLRAEQSFPVLYSERKHLFPFRAFDDPPLQQVLRVFGTWPDASSAMAARLAIVPPADLAPTDARRLRSVSGASECRTAFARNMSSDCIVHLGGAQLQSSLLSSFLTFDLSSAAMQTLLDRRCFPDTERQPPLVCYQDANTPAGQIGRLSFHPAPRLSGVLWHIDRVGVRVFVEPGWNFAHSVAGHNFSGPNVVSLKLPSLACSGYYEQDAFHFAFLAAVKQAPPTAAPTGTPPATTTVHATTTPQPATPAAPAVKPSLSQDRLQRLAAPPARSAAGAGGGVSTSPASASSVAAILGEDLGVFKFAENYRVHQQELTEWRRKFQHSQVLDACFYANGNQQNGTLVGQVSFFMDHSDAAELVGFIMFAIMGVPFVCGATLACYAYKHRRLRHRTRRLRLIRQQQEIESRLLQEMGIELPAHSPLPGGSPAR